MRQLTTSMLMAAAAVAAASFATTALADEHKKVKIINDTRHVMVTFHANRIGSEWPEDYLGENTLAAGKSVVLDFGPDDNCLYDFTGIFDDGDKIEKDRINVCKIRTFRFAED